MKCDLFEIDLVQIYAVISKLNGTGIERNHCVQAAVKIIGDENISKHKFWILTQKLYTEGVGMSTGAQWYYRKL